MAKGTRNLRKQTKMQKVSEMQDRLTALEGIVGQIFAAASNDILRLERILRPICEQLEIEFEEAVVEPNVETTQSESE
jgi:uncharacterized membrane protein YjjP (DUF1212 family)